MGRGSARRICTELRPAEGDVGAAFCPARWERRWPLAADGAVGIGQGGADLGTCRCCRWRWGARRSKGEQGAAEEMVLVGEDLEGFGDLE